MSKRIFIKEEIEQLLTNNSVKRCTKKSITYTQSFKEMSIKLYEQGLTAKEIFRQAGLDINLIGCKQPKECLCRWRKIVKRKGIGGLKEVRGKKGGGGRPKTKYSSDKEKIKYLETKVEYLKAENDFLAKLRGLNKE
jgi:hypothetical protein